jgi:hypothetical protein
MKIRNGFVSNSSSSSFCIYGACIEHGSAVLEKIEDVYETAEEQGLYANSPEGYDSWFVGMSPLTMKDEQTMGEFKKNVEEKLEKFFGGKVTCCFHQEAYYS